MDIVIPLGPNDTDVFPAMLPRAKQYIAGRETIYVISNQPVVQAGCIWVPETSFPFSLKEVISILGEQYASRAGWYYQQILKFYAHHVIAGLSHNYLILEADNFFLNDTNFFDEDSGKPIFNPGTEYHFPYFQHMARLNLTPPLRRVSNEMSGIAHMLMYDKDIIEDLLNCISSANGGKEAWRVYIEAIDEPNKAYSGAADHEVYFNFVLDRFPDEYVIRRLKWDNTGDIHRLDEFKAQGYNYVTYHWYMR